MWVTLVSFRNGVSGCPAYFLFANRLSNIFITEAWNVLQESVELVRCDMNFDVNSGCRSSQAEAKMTFCPQCPRRLDPKISRYLLCHLHLWLERLALLLENNSRRHHGCYRIFGFHRNKSKKLSMPVR